MKNNNRFVLGFVSCLLVILTIFGALAIGQSLTPKLEGAISTLSFEKIKFLNNGGNEAKVVIYTAEIQMSNGVSCYFLTPVSIAIDLETMGDIKPLGCVK